MSEDNQLPSLPQSESVDIFGLAGISKYLAGPIIRGVGRVLRPLVGRLDNAAQIANFNAWDEAIKLRGYAAQSVNLTLGERAEVQMLATAIQQQHNREIIAAEAIEHAKLEFDPGDTIDIPPLEVGWIEHFWRLAQEVSDRDMQSFWGMVLARRAAGRSPFSARALQFLSTLEGSEAEKLQHLAKYVVTVEAEPGYFDHAVLTYVPDKDVWLSDEEKDALTRVNVRLRRIVGDTQKRLFGSLGVFIEGGWGHSIQQKIPNGKLRFSIAGQAFGADVPKAKHLPHSLYEIGGSIAISALGMELFGMIRTEPDPAHVEAVTEAFRINGLDLRPL